MLSVATAMACGGNARVDGSGGSTVTGASGGGGTTSSSGTATTSATATGAGGADPLPLGEACAIACAFFEECSPLQQQCMARCLAGANADCLTQYVDVLRCAGGEIEACSWTPICEPEIAAWYDCDSTSEPCSAEICSGGDLSCSCEASCAGLGRQILCGGLGEMPFCSCWIEGIYLGTCVPTTSAACSLDAGSCCDALFP